MPTDLIRYDLIVQEALRGVVRKVVGDAARDGLPGEHFFHISFRTKDRGVRLSDRMRERYPDTMTIVLQHQFWDLAVTEEAFEVGLSFGGIAERVRVPFSAITEFFDETVQFGLRFEVATDEAAPEADGQGQNDEEKTGVAPEAAPPPSGSSVTTLPHPLRAPTPGDAAESPAPEKTEESGKVLSIDAFRKKP